MDGIFDSHFCGVWGEGIVLVLSLVLTVFSESFCPCMPSGPCQPDASVLSISETPGRETAEPGPVAETQATLVWR